MPAIHHGANAYHYFVASMDTAAIVGILGSIIGFLPPIGALLGVLWYLVLFYDRFIGQEKNDPDPPAQI